MQWTIERENILPRKRFSCCFRFIFATSMVLFDTTIPSCFCVYILDFRFSFSSDPFSSCIKFDRNQYLIFIHRFLALTFTFLSIIRFFQTPSIQNWIAIFTEYFITFSVLSSNLIHCGYSVVHMHEVLLTFRAPYQNQFYSCICVCNGWKWVIFDTVECSVVCVCVYFYHIFARVAFYSF